MITRGPLRATQRRPQTLWQRHRIADLSLKTAEITSVVAPRGNRQKAVMLRKPKPQAKVSKREEA